MLRSVKKKQFLVKTALCQKQLYVKKIFLYLNLTSQLIINDELITTTT